MELIILAAGFATRLYPLTLNRPKPLLEVAGKPIIEYVLDNVALIEGINRTYVVTNAKFADRFHRWADRYREAHPGLDINVISDGSTDDSNKLGAIGDLYFVLTSKGIKDDIIVVAGDNLFSQSLEEFISFCRRMNAPVLAIYDVGDLTEVKNYNSIDADEEGRITLFEEKPEHPRSTITGIALYYYPKSALPLIQQYITEGNNPDQPGRLVEWMYRRTPFYTWPVPGTWYDIGSKEMLEEAHRIFAKVGD
jgi:glucose-1-phosphate thymidylyltransferase